MALALVLSYFMLSFYGWSGVIGMGLDFLENVVEPSLEMIRSC